MKDKPLEEEVESTLNSLDGVIPADPGPYFYTRLMARHQPVRTSVAPVHVLWKALVVMVLFVNVTVYYLISDDLPKASSDEIDLLTADYFDHAELGLSDLDYNYQDYE